MRKVRAVVSCPPFWVPVETKRPAGLPMSCGSEHTPRDQNYSATVTGRWARLVTSGAPCVRGRRRGTYRALLPQAAGRVHQRLDLRRRHAKAGAEAEHEGVVRCEARSRRDLVVLADARRSHLRQHLVRERLCDTEKRGLATDRLEALLHLEREGAHVAVHAVVDNRDL